MSKFIPINQSQTKRESGILKEILDTLKNTNENISEFISNQKNDFETNNSVNFNNFIIYYFLFKDIFYQSDSSDNSDESSESPSLSSDSLVSVSSDSLE